MRLSTPRSWGIAILCISGLIGFGVRLVAGQSIVVSGRAVDAVSGRAISGAQVTNGLRTVATDAEGRFQIEVAVGRWGLEDEFDQVCQALRIEKANAG